MSGIEDLRRRRQSGASVPRRMPAPLRPRTEPTVEAKDKGQSRMTVIRRRAASDLKRRLGTAKKNRQFSAEVADLDRTFRDRRRDQAAGASTT